MIAQSSAQLFSLQPIFFSIALHTETMYNFSVLCLILRGFTLVGLFIVRVSQLVEKHFIRMQLVKISFLQNYVNFRNKWPKECISLRLKVMLSHRPTQLSSRTKITVFIDGLIITAHYINRTEFDPFWKQVFCFFNIIIIDAL